MRSANVWFYMGYSSSCHYFYILRSPTLLWVTPWFPMANLSNVQCTQPTLRLRLLLSPFCLHSNFIVNFIGS